MVGTIVSEPEGSGFDSKLWTFLSEPVCVFLWAFHSPTVQKHANQVQAGLPPLTHEKQAELSRRWIDDLCVFHLRHKKSSTYWSSTRCAGLCVARRTSASSICSSQRTMLSKSGAFSTSCQKTTIPSSSLSKRWGGASVSLYDVPLCAHQLVEVLSVRVSDRVLAPKADGGQRRWRLRVERGEAASEFKGQQSDCVGADRSAGDRLLQQGPQPSHPVHGH